MHALEGSVRMLCFALVPDVTFGRVNLSTSFSSLSSAVVRRFSLAGIAAASVLLAGCASHFGAQVTAWHQQGVPLQGLSYRFQPDAAQADSLEYAAYAAQVREQLMKHGMVEAGGSRHDVDVRFGYSVDGGQPVHYQQPEYAYVYQGSRPVRRDRVQPDGSVLTYWEMHPVYGYDLVGYSTYQRVVFTHQLRLTLTRSASGGKPPSGLARLYEGTVVHQSDSSALNHTVPRMVRALFKDFPGPNGQTRHVEVPSDLEPAGGQGSAPRGETGTKGGDDAEGAPGKGKSGKAAAPGAGGR